MAAGYITMTEEEGFIGAGGELGGRSGARID